MAARPKKNRFSFLRFHKFPSWAKNLYVITGAAFLAWMLFFDRNDLITQVRLQMKLDQYRQKKHYYEQQINAVNKEQQELLTNKEALERFAREEYLMKKDEEDLFVIVQEKAEEK
jgi:cell division protein FtsB